MTTRELRKMLFEVHDQSMTIAELRRLLFEVSEQDEEITERQMAYITRMHDKEKKG